MNTDVTQTPWRQFKIQLRKTWSELTDEDLAAIFEDSEDLAHVVQHRYGCRPQEATNPLRIVEAGFLPDQITNSIGSSPYPRLKWNRADCSVSTVDRKPLGVIGTRLIEGDST